VLLVSTLVCESYCAAAVMVTNAAVRPAIIFIVDIVSAPRLHIHVIYGCGATQYQYRKLTIGQKKCLISRPKKTAPEGGT
jgi:hypothetical protein